MADLAMPNFTAVAANIRIISQAQASIAIELARMHNSPAVGRAAQIVQAIDEYSATLEKRFDEIYRRCDAKYGKLSLFSVFIFNFYLSI